MTDAPRAERPPENSPTEPLSSIVAQRRQYERLATDLMPRGELRRYVPFWPWWCRRIGKDVIDSVVHYRMPDPSEIRLLLDAHARATERRDEEQEALREDAGWCPRPRGRRPRPVK